MITVKLERTTKQKMVQLMAHRRAIVALAQAHGWDSRVDQSLRHVSSKIHLQIQRLRVGQ